MATRWSSAIKRARDRLREQYVAVGKKLGSSSVVTFDAPEPIKLTGGTIDGYQWKCPFSHDRYRLTFQAKLVGKCGECEESLDRLIVGDYDGKTGLPIKR